ncbi:MAG: BatA domain-containing protein, partial [Rubripirellula sp.]
MTLLNGILALGALAFTVPLAIHLLFRNRFQVMDWGAMHLLEAVVRINRRRLQLMHLLLLILRCLIPIILAFCLARPVLTGFKVLPGDAPRTVVIAIDDSQSMAARDASGMTRMEVAKRSVETLLESLSRRDEVILIPSSRSSLPVVSSGPQEAMEDVRKMRAEAGPVDLGILLAAAIEASSGGVYPQRQIVVVGDFASESLGDESLATLSNLSETLQQQTLPPAIGFLNLGKDSDQLSNLSVDQIESNAAAVVAGRGGSYSATIRNASDLPLRDIRLTWFLDDVEVGQSLVTVASRSSTVARLTHRIDQVGVHVLTASVEHGDALMEDNRRSLAIDVIDEIKVLLVNGDPSQEPLEGETDYLAIALSPFAFGGEDQPDAVQTSVCLRQQLQKRLEADEPDMVVLANVSKLSESERADLSQFVQRGGTMVVFDGDQVDVEGYNAAWTSADGDWRLPATLGSVIGERDGENRLPQPPGVHHSIYSPWESLRTGNEQPFADVDVFAYRKLSVRRDPTGDLSRSVGETASTISDQQISGSVEEGDDASGGVPITLWSLGNGDPLAVMARRGAGKVVQFSIPCDTAWSSLPL